MPPRFAYWTITVDNQPTAFRAREIADLLPTFKRLKERHPSAQMLWFERGRLWSSREQAREAARARRAPSAESREPKAEGQEPRPRTWRPGGDHRDPRQKYKDARKARWQRFKQRIRRKREDKA